MADNKAIRISDLDFDQIKQNLKDYLKSQSEFSDYDFEGSGLSVLLNILAYNTHLNAFLANASFNEAFLDSAIKRSSVISRAKEMNYMAKSKRCARAFVDVTIQNPVSADGIVTLERYTPFTSSVAGSTFTFYNVKPMAVPSEDGEYAFENVELFEGRLVTNSFIVENNATPEDTRFTLLNWDVDTETIQVVVQTSTTDTTIETWTLATDIAGIDSDSQVFYIQQNSDGYYQVYFGDGVLGKKLAVGNVVRVNYLVTNGAAANVSATVTQTFSIANPIAGNTDILVSTVRNSIGGDDEESIESIKFNAPLALTRNNRAVTANDYWSLISEKMPAVDSVNVYGGEDEDPPVYGKVFISVKPKSGYIVPETLKDEIVAEVLRTNNIITVIPEFVDPDYTFLTFDVDVKYDATRTTLSSSDMAATVQNALKTHFDETLGKFRSPFYFSKMSRTIDNCNDAIVGNVTKFTLQKRFAPTFASPFYAKFGYSIQIREKTFVSNVFLFTNSGVQVQAYLADDGAGKINVINFQTLQVVKSGVGTVNYLTGAINISNLVIDSFVGGEAQLKLNATPVVDVANVLPSRNQIIAVDDSTESRQSNVSAGIKINCSPVS